MKKHKSVVAILLAVMMIFTMMPAMAFAADGEPSAPDATKIQYSADYSKVTVPEHKAYIQGSDGVVDVPVTTYDTVRHYESDGKISVTIDPKEAKKYNWTLPTLPDKKFYDLSVAELAVNGVALKSVYGFGSFNPAKVDSILLNVPSYVDNAKDASGNPTNAAHVSFADFKTATKWDGKLEGADKFDAKARTEQTLKLSFGGEFTGATTNNDTPILGTIPEKEVKILAAAADPNFDAKYFFDAEDDKAVTGSATAKDYTTWYDGAAHNFMVSTVDGWTPAFYTLDLKSGKWNAATSVTVSDVQEKATQVKIEWTKAGATAPDTTKTHMFNVNLVKAGTASIEFAPGEEGFLEKVYSVSGTQYDAKSYIIAVAAKEYVKGGDAELKLKDAATAKAVEANKADLIAYFNELYDVVAGESKRNPNCVDLSIDSKDLTAKEKQAIDKKYAALLARVSVSVDTEDYAFVALNGVDLSDYEIEFTQAPAKKVIKTKKAKSTKTVKFNVKAECKNGTVVKYKLINAPKKSISIDANTGKITVKKGLAKGTYTFKVKAYVTGSNNLFSHTTESEVQTIKVVVKKVKK